MTDNNIAIYTDGACSGNPGPGGWACAIEHEGSTTDLSGGFAKMVPVSLGTLGFHLEAEAGRCYRLKESPKGLTGSEFATKLARSLGWIYVGEAEFVGGSAVNVWLKVEG